MPRDAAAFVARSNPHGHNGIRDTPREKRGVHKHI